MDKSLEGIFIGLVMYVCTYMQTKYSLLLFFLWVALFDFVVVVDHSMCA